LEQGKFPAEIKLAGGFSTPHKVSGIKKAGCQGLLFLTYQNELD